MMKKMSRFVKPANKINKWKNTIKWIMNVNYDTNKYNNS